MPLVSYNILVEKRASTCQTSIISLTYRFVKYNLPILTREIFDCYMIAISLYHCTLWPKSWSLATSSQKESV